MPTEVDGDKVIFTTDHFSYYTIVGVNVMVPNTSDKPDVLDTPNISDTPDVENKNTMVIVAVGVVVIGIVVFLAFWFSKKIR